MLQAAVSEAKSQTGHAKRPQTPLPERERYPLSLEAPGHPSLTGNGNSIPPSAAARSRSAAGSLQRLYGNQAVLQMRNSSGGQTVPSVPLRPSQSGILQRKCACGGAAGMSGECEECSELRKERARLVINQKINTGDLEQRVAVKTHQPTSEQPAAKASRAFFPAQGAGGTFFAPAIQPKLVVNEPGDAYEQEADQVAGQVMRMLPGDRPMIQRRAISSVQRMCAECAEEEQGEKKEEGAGMVQRKCAVCGGEAQGTGEEEHGGGTGEMIQRKCAACTAEHGEREKEESVVQRRATGPGVSGPALQRVEQGLAAGGGRPMAIEIQRFMERRFGHDFSGVRVHTGGQAAEMNRDLRARAFTHGRDVYFGTGEYSPDDPAGRTLLAHELTHVVQQGAAGGTAVQRGSAGAIIQRDDKTEAERLSEESIPTATMVVSLSGLEFHLAAEASYQAGPKQPQLLQIVLKALLGPNYQAKHEEPLGKLLIQELKFRHTKDFRGAENAYEGEPIRPILIDAVPLSVILQYLQAHNLSTVLTDDQRKQLIRAFINSRLWKDVVASTKAGEPLPAWYTQALFQREMAQQSALLDAYMRAFELALKAPDEQSAKLIRHPAFIPVIDFIYAGVVPMTAVQKDISLAADPATQLLYRALWHIPEKEGPKPKNPPRALRSEELAIKLMQFFRANPKEAQEAEEDAKARKQLLVFFQLLYPLPEKDLTVLDPFPALIAAPDLNPDHSTVLTAENLFRLWIDIDAGDYRPLIDKTVTAMGRRVFYSWAVHPLPESLKRLKEQGKTKPDELVKRADDFVKNSPANLGTPLDTYGADEDWEQTIKMNSFSIGSFLLVGYAAPQYRPEWRKVQKPSSAGHPFFIFDPTQLATTSTYADLDQVKNLEKQASQATGKEKEDLDAEVKRLKTRETTDLGALTQQDLDDTEKLLQAVEKLRKYIQDDRQKQIPYGGSKTLDPFPIRLKKFDPVLYAVYNMIREAYDPRKYGELYAIDEFAANLRAQSKELIGLKKRVGAAHGAFRIGSPHYRVVAAIVKEDDGNVVPLLMVAGYHPDADPANGQYKIKLVDVTFDSPRKGDMIYVGDTYSSEDEAIRSAFNQFGKDNKYGDGTIVYRLPGQGSAGNVKSTTTVWEYLEYAIMAAGLILMVVGSMGTLAPVAAAVVMGLAISAAVVAGALAIRNIYKRHEKGVLEMDTETALDIISIIGAVVMGVGTIARVSLAASRAATMARAMTLKRLVERLDKLLLIYDVTDIGANIYLTSVKVKEDVDAINKLDIPEYEKDQMIRDLAFGVIQQGAMMAVSVRGNLHQIAEHYRARVENSSFRSMMERGWIKADAAGELHITEEAPPFLREAHQRAVAEREAGVKGGEGAPKPVGAEPGTGVKGESARKEVVVEALRTVPTKDGKHQLTLTERGRIIRCSDFCAELRVKYEKILSKDPELARQLQEIELDIDKAVKAGDKAAEDAGMAKARELEGVLRETSDRWQHMLGMTEDEMDAALQFDLVTIPEVTGGEKSGHRIEGRKVPKQRRLLDGQDIMTLEELATPGGFRRALERLGQVMGKRISDVEALAKHWEAARAHVLKGKAVTDFDRETVNKKLYPATQKKFWALVRKDRAAVKMLDAIGLELPPDGGAPLAKLGPLGQDNKTGKLTDQERRVSLDHSHEKALAENWTRALDADNLELMFQNANSQKEIVQARHGMRGDAPKGGKGGGGGGKKGPKLPVLKPGETFQFPDGSTATLREHDGAVVNISTVSEPKKRKGYEKKVAPGELLGVELAPTLSQGAPTGHESPYGGLQAPVEIKEHYQKRGIEDHIRTLYSDIVPPGFTLHLTTESKPYAVDEAPPAYKTEVPPANGQTNLLKSITYKVEVSHPDTPGKQRLYEAEISVRYGADGKPQISVSATPYRIAEIADPVPATKGGPDSPGPGGPSGPKGGGGGGGGPVSPQTHPEASRALAELDAAMGKLQERSQKGDRGAQVYYEVLAGARKDLLRNPEKASVDNARGHMQDIEESYPTSAMQLDAGHFMQKNRPGLLKGSLDAVKGFLSLSKRWKTAILGLKHGDAGAQKVLKALQAFRAKEVKALAKKYNAKELSGASHEPESDIDLNFQGAKAGENLLAAEAEMKARFGDDWRELLAIGKSHGADDLGERALADAKAAKKRMATHVAEDVAKDAPRAGKTITVKGYAQGPRLKWTKNPDGAVRSIDEAVEIARKNGVEIPDDILFKKVKGKYMPDDTKAQYFSHQGFDPEKLITWNDFYNRDLDQLLVRIEDSVFESDEAIVAVLGHEMHELNNLRRLFEELEGSMTARKLHGLINPGIKGNLHDQAWDIADELVAKMRKSAGGAQ